MGLYPSVINDGTADHTIQVRGQVPSDNSITTEYFEVGDNLRVYSDYKLPKGSSPVRRQSSRLYFGAVCNADTGARKDIVVNIAITRDKGHADADVNKAVQLAFASLPTPAARSNFVSRMP